MSKSYKLSTMSKLENIRKKNSDIENFLDYYKQCREGDLYSDIDGKVPPEKLLAWMLDNKPLMEIALKIGDLD